MPSIPALKSRHRRCDRATDALASVLSPDVPEGAVCPSGEDVPLFPRETISVAARLEMRTTWVGGRDSFAIEEPRRATSSIGPVWATAAGRVPLKRAVTFYQTALPVDFR